MIGASMSHIGIGDRGFNYGDGLFETMLVAEGEPVWWDAHYARLHRGCAALRIACPASATLLAQAREFVVAMLRGSAEDAPQVLSIVRGEPVEPEPRGPGSTSLSRTGAGVRAKSENSLLRVALKLVLTRGIGGRGYAPPRDAEPTIAWTLHHAPTPVRGGIAVRWCDLRLAQQPALAGFKHLNRLENVLARGEWDDPALAEGLLRDTDGHVIGATAANLFAVRDGTLFTPRLHRCGIAGVTRAWVMTRETVVEADLATDDIESADELFLTSSLRGILPVARLGGREWTVGPMIRRLQGLLHDEVPAL